MDISILGSRDKIVSIDKGNVLGSVEEFPKQCKHAWEESSKVEIPHEYTKVKNIVMCGMGGSGLAARIIDSAFAKEIKVPLYRINDYELPGFVNKDTLAICSSYSGSTEETLSNAIQAIERKAKLIVIASGGPLIDLALANKVPYYKIDPKFNFSNQPRMAVGYSVIGQLTLVSKCGFINFGEVDVKRAIGVMEALNENINIEIDLESNYAKKIAFELFEKIVLFVSSEHLVGAVHTVNNQFNENSKNLTFDFIIPEINHHLLEGIKHPHVNPENIKVFLIDSDLYSDKNKKRLQITQDVFQKNKIECVNYKPFSGDKFSQVLETIQFGMYVNFYLSMLYEVDPSPIPWVSYFKEQLLK